MSGDELTLEDFAMDASYGRLTGVAIAVHAIRDGYLLMHVGVGCKNKVTHLLPHDWEQPCNLRQGWTEVNERDLITGASTRVGPYLRSWQKRMDSGFVAVVTATFLELTGEGLGDQVERANEELPVPALLIPAQGYDGDEFTGYAAVANALVRSMDWKGSAPKAKRVGILGYLFDRYEGDHAGNLVQIRGLLKPLGLELGVVLLSGQDYASYQALPDAGVQVVLPYMKPGWKRTKRKLKGAHRFVEADLPMGLGGTARFTRAVAEAASVDTRLVDAYLAKRRARALAPLERLRGRFRGQRVAVFAEAPLAAGLCAMLQDLGLPLAWVGVRGRSLGGEAELRAALERTGYTLPEGVRVDEAPSLQRIRDVGLAMLLDGDLTGVIGSATELGVFRALAPEELGPKLLTETLGAPAPFMLELGFPCQDYHALGQMPFMGYGGLVSFAQRVINAPRLWSRR